MGEYCEKNDPVEKAKRALAKQKPEKPQENEAKTASRYRPAQVEHIVNLRDQSQCTYVDRTGVRCNSKRWLDKHHVLEFSKGGRHEPNNLETLCAAHHKIRHMQAESNSSRDEWKLWSADIGFFNLVDWHNKPTCNFEAW